MPPWAGARLGGMREREKVSVTVGKLSVSVQERVCLWESVSDCQ